jgi:hypothetical protein
MNKYALEQTLALAGAEGEKHPTILKHGFNPEERQSVHQETNKLIQSCLRGSSLGECIHITGEMRALTDPFHRYICEEINKNDKDVFKVVYNLPEQLLPDHLKVVEWNLEKWASGGIDSDWREQLLSIYLIANRSVNLFALDTSDQIQYSVFGHKYILLQEKHQEKAREKNTWLLESEAINSILTVRAAQLVKAARPVDEGDYHRFTLGINSVAARRFLSLLSEKQGRLEAEYLLNDDVARDFCDSTDVILESLRVMGFVNRNPKGLVEITTNGMEFFNDR